MILTESTIAFTMMDFQNLCKELHNQGTLDATEFDECDKMIKNILTKTGFTF